jgi:hypothetical protein
MMLPPFLMNTTTDPIGFFPTSVEAAMNPSVVAYWKLPEELYKDHLTFCAANQRQPTTKEALLHDFYVVANKSAQAYITLQGMTKKDLIQHDCDTPFDYLMQAIQAGREGAALSANADPLVVRPPHGEYNPTDVTRYAKDLGIFQSDPAPAKDRDKTKAPSAQGADAAEKGLF